MIAQRNHGCLIPGNIQDQVGWGYDQSGLAEDIPAQAGVVDWMNFKDHFQSKIFHDQRKIVWLTITVMHSHPLTQLFLLFKKTNLGVP